MKKLLLFLMTASVLVACGDKKDKEKTGGDGMGDKKETAPADLPYTASYSSSWSTDVSDADLKTVLVSYKDWADGAMDKVATAYADTLAWDRPSGEHIIQPNAEIMKIWGTYRDSLSSITIDMEGWHKMYATDKKEGYVVVWYKEIDTYKTGQVDSGYYHDINALKNGKIIWLSQYKRPAK